MFSGRIDKSRRLINKSLILSICHFRGLQGKFWRAKIADIDRPRDLIDKDGYRRRTVTTQGISCFTLFQPAMSSCGSKHALPINIPLVFVHFVG